MYLISQNNQTSNGQCLFIIIQQLNVENLTAARTFPLTVWVPK